MGSTRVSQAHVLALLEGREGREAHEPYNISIQASKRQVAVSRPEAVALESTCLQALFARLL